MLTATDLLVAAGRATVGPNQCLVTLPPQTIENGLNTIASMLNDGIEKMMPSSDLMPVILVGGGAMRAAVASTKPRHVAAAAGARCW